MSLEGIPKGADSIRNMSETRYFAEGARPIIVSIRKEVEDIKNHAEREEATKARHFLAQNFQGNRQALDVDWKSDHISLYEKKLQHGGQMTYVISPIDERNKFSEGLYLCTSLIVSGIDKETKKKISFLTHQAPFFVYSDTTFLNNMNIALSEMKERCMPDTIDAVLVGGNLRDDDIGILPGEPTMEVASEQYSKAVHTVSEKVKEVLGFKPVLVNGPNLYPSKDNIYFDTKEGHAYLVRRLVNYNVGSFTTDQLEKPLE